VEIGLSILTPNITSIHIGDEIHITRTQPIG